MKAGRALRRAAGACLLLLVTVPFYRLLPESSRAAAHARTVTASFSAFLWSGAAILLIIGIIAGFAIRPPLLRNTVERARAWLCRPAPLAFAAGLALISGALTLLFTRWVLEGKPPFIDAMAQLVHARYLAEGRLAGALPDGSGFWIFQNLVVTEEGLLSQYPPGHVLLLALGLRVGAVEAVGAAMAAVTVFFTARAAEGLLPDRRATARIGATLVALSPFMIPLAGSYMNHISASAFAALAIYFLTRVWGDGLQWAVAAGAAAGAAFAVRPLAGLVVGAVLALGAAWRGLEGNAAPARLYLRRLGALVTGALPFGAAVGLYNAYLFGSPFRFGYVVAQGPQHGLGFHMDPWGNMYGLREALGYTSSDLVALSLFLLQTPLPLVGLVGVYLLVARRLTVGERIIAAWALLPVVANFFYWHHDLIMGPRMLAESAPAWALLTSVSGVGLVRRTPVDMNVWRRRFHPRSGLAAALVLALLAGIGYFAPRRALAYGGEWQASSRIQPPQTDGPSLVFVHEGWSNRLGAQLASRGLRQDSVMRLLANLPPCLLQAHLEGWVDPSGRPPTEAEQRSIAAGCQRQAAADRLGTLGLPNLLWQGDLPDLPPSGPMFVRDLGPERNGRLLQRLDGRPPLVLLPSGHGSEPRLLPYDEGMRLLWAESSAADDGTGAEPPGPSRRR